MKVIVNQERVDRILDELLPRYLASPRKYPFNRPDAILPQQLVPAWIRDDTKKLVMFYTLECVWMRGAIESIQAFSASLRMFTENPWMLEPHIVALMRPQTLQEIIKPYIGWDSKAAADHCVEISRRILRSWKGDACNIVKGLRSEREVFRRLCNKRTKGDRESAGPRGEGFPGYQKKMACLWVYFIDWEGLLEKRFRYSPPVDIHNYRVALSTAALTIEDMRGEYMRPGERLAAPWRNAVLSYLRRRDADPILVCNVLWLFSLLMCGNSPATTTFAPRKDPDLFSTGIMNGGTTAIMEISQRARRGLEKTCFVCAFNDICEFAIPSRPYSTEGKLVLLPRQRFDLDGYAAMAREPEFPEPLIQESLL